MNTFEALVLPIMSVVVTLAVLGIAGMVALTVSTRREDKRGF